MLRELGIRGDDRIAAVLPDGPEAAAAFLAVASCASFAPLNPGYRESEFETCLRQLAPAAILIEPGDSAARSAAQYAGVPLIELAPVPDAPAGIFTLDGQPRANRGASSSPLLDDIALILHTSGTTATPKLVPLTHRNLYWAGTYIGQPLALSASDRCLNFSPLFHSLGITGGIVAPLVSGAATICTPGFNGEAFCDWMEEFAPTWYSAVPAVHQAILHCAAARISAFRSLRLVRSAGAALPPALKDRLEHSLGVPVVQVYGMSEAPPITVEPLPPGVRKAGSVGVAQGPEVAILGENGRPGEVLVRGPHVMRGYLGNPAANEAAFVGRWFRTGDVGHLDDDGFLFLTGRIGELINRGGEKVTPLEIDEILATHPAVAHAAAFAIPGGNLGEEIAAAVVLHAGMRIDEAGLQAYAAARLGDHKVPRRFVFVSEIPSGPTGKLNRLALASQLVPQIQARPRPPRSLPATEMEHIVASAWAGVLHIPDLGIDDNFFDCGGDSLGGIRMLSKLAPALQRARLPPGLLLQAPTIRKMAAVLADPTRLAGCSRVVAIQPEGAACPLFVVGDGLEFRLVARHLGSDQPFYGVRVPPFEEEAPPYTVERIASRCVEALRGVRPSGPYALGGWCFGGLVAYEMARQLEACGQPVTLVALFEARNILPASAWVRFRRACQKIRFHLRRARDLGYVLRRVRTVSISPLGTLWRIVHRGYARLEMPMPRLLQSHRQAESQAIASYRLSPYSGRVVHFWAEDRPRGKYRDLEYEWGKQEFEEVPGNHETIFQSPNAAILAAKLRTHLTRARQ